MSQISNSIDEVKKMNIYEKLTLVQAKLEVKKEATHAQLKSKYRKIEGILEGLKPLLVEYRLNLSINDEVINIGEVDFREVRDNGEINEKGNRFYIKANLVLVNIDNLEQTIIATGLSREAQIKKGVQVEMLTGMASTYARKKGLEGLFLLADNDALDPDSIIDEQSKIEDRREAQDELYKSFVDEINKATIVDEGFMALCKRIKNSYLPKVDKEILLNQFTIKGQALPKE